LTWSLNQALNEELKGAVHTGGTEAYGVDPSFNTHSRLYRTDALQRRWQFFNSSERSPELSMAGAPFAFFPRSSHGYDDGFPVFFPVQTQSPAVPVSFRGIRKSAFISFVYPPEQ
jgi:hypothetical protein